MLDRAVTLAAGAAAIGIAALFVGQTLRLADVKAELATEQRDRAADRAAMAEAAASGIAAARAEEQRTAAAVQEVAHVARLDAARARADAVSAAAVGLRQPAAALAASGGGAAEGPGLTAGGQATRAPAWLLADVLGEVDETAGELAAAYDLARAAGLACERSYDTLTPNE